MIGNDIGCGMTLFATGIKMHKFKKDKLFRRLGSEVGNSLQTAALGLLDGVSETVSDPENMLGTLGHGNHFAEFLAVEKVIDCEKCEALNIKKNDVLSSGSHSIPGKMRLCCSKALVLTSTRKSPSFNEVMWL